MQDDFVFGFFNIKYNNIPIPITNTNPITTYLINPCFEESPVMGLIIPIFFIAVIYL
jgi:hypothetical protein